MKTLAMVFARAATLHVQWPLHPISEVPKGSRLTGEIEVTVEFACNKNEKSVTHLVGK